MTTQFPRRFYLQRDVDTTGVSGTGIVADGVVWPDNSVSVRWRGERPSIVFWTDFTDVLAIHGHGGNTKVVWLDPSNESMRLARIAEGHSKNLTAGGMTSGDCDECGWSWPCPTYVWATTDREYSSVWNPADDELVAAMDAEDAAAEEAGRG